MKASEFVPEWQNDARAEITVEQLLQMTSGLDPLSSEREASSPAVGFVFDGVAAREILLNLPLAHEPGTVFNYANAVSQVLVLIIEKATERTYADFLSESIWVPISAPDALVWNNEPNGFPRAYTSLMATPEDWLRIGLLIKDGGEFDGQQVISSAYIDTLIQGSSKNPNYGYQTWLGNEYHDIRYCNETKTGLAVSASAPFLVDDLIYLNGFGGQRVHISRSLDLVIDRTGEARLDWDDAELPNLVILALTDKANK